MKKKIGFSFEEYQKEIWQKMSLKEKFQHKYWGLTDFLRITFLVAVGRCPHEATMGEIGNPIYYCLQCRKWIPNAEWKEDAKLMKGFEGKVMTSKTSKVFKP